jgi:trehalose/maltose hydrolase-like predicted phosphorylase
VRLELTPRWTGTVGDGAGQTVGQRLAFPVTGNRTVTLTKYVGVSTSHDAAAPAAPESAARRYFWAAAVVGFDDLLTENTAAWAALWAGLSWSVSPAGLSSNGYDGHIFWDAETWMYPTLLAQHPDLAAGMNGYRYQRLAAATAHARETGFSGARFPWESAEDGTEQIPPPASVNSEGLYEQHVTADVALAQWQYYLATGDHGWLVTPGPGGSYHINNVTGPDEENPDVNDEAYTTVAAATARRDIDYYVPRSDPGGPSMNDAINAIDTAALGSAGCTSFVYIQRSIAPFMRDAFDQFSETRTGGAFTFMTGIGGFLQEFLYGYSGLRWNDDAVRLDPCGHPRPAPHRAHPPPGPNPDRRPRPVSGRPSLQLSADPLAAVDGSPATGWHPEQTTASVSVPLAVPSP